MSSSLAFGQWLRQRREDCDLSREALARQANCSAETIRKYEAGTSHPSRELVAGIAAALAVPDAEIPALIEFARRCATPAETPVSAGPASTISPRPRPPHPGYLPVARTSFVGREQQIATLCSWLTQPDARLVTLLGSPGIGKTRLGLAVAARLRPRFPDGVFFIGLGALTDPALVAPTIAHILGLQEGAGRPLHESLLDYLQDKQVLLLLDNFEHLTPAVPLVSRLLDTCPGLQVLVTSRVALALYGERPFVVPALTLPAADSVLPLAAYAEVEAIALFMQRARASRPLLELNAHTAPVIAEICHRLDGVPLALELAAARCRLLPLPELLARLTHSLRVLTAGAADWPPRQRSLRAAIAWSYDLLAPAEQLLFRRLAVFVRGATLDAVAAVCHLPDDPPRDPLDEITSLLDKSLLNSETAPVEEARWWMLWSIREYAQEQTAAVGETERIQAQHAAYYLALAEAAEPHLRSPQRELWLARLDREHDNLRAALTWCLAAPERAETGLRLAGALHWFWYFRGYLTEGREWLEKALERAGMVRQTAAGARALAAAGRLAFLQDDYAVMLPRLEESVASARAVGARHELAYGLAYLGLALTCRTRSIEAGGARLIEEAVAIFREVVDDWGLAFALDALAHAMGWLDGSRETITRYKQESLDLYRRLDDLWGTAYQLSELGRIALFFGDYEAARTLLEEGLGLERQVGDKWRIAHSVRSLGDVAWYRDDLTRATVLYEESLGLFQQLGDRADASNALRHLGHVAHERGDQEAAAHYYRRSLTLVCELGHEQNIALCLAALAAVATATGQHLR